MLQMGVGLKGNQIRSQQAEQEVFPIREYSENLGGWKRDVEKESDVGVGDRVPQQLRQEHQMVIVDPDEITGPNVPDDCVAELPVRLDICLPPSRRERDS
jgi:hypothetical protein